MAKPQFDVAKFEELIQRRGRSFSWERARRCPCYNARTRSPLETCVDCDGLGWVYSLQGAHKATLLSITASKKWAKFGEWLEGDALMTFPASLLIGDKDRITLTTGVNRESEILIKGTRDVLLNREVVDILELADVDRTYRLGIDFTLSGSTIVWQGAHPATGAAYSVLYTYRPVYVVWLQLPQVRAQVDQGGGALLEMPRKVALRTWLDFKRPQG